MCTVVRGRCRCVRGVESSKGGFTGPEFDSVKINLSSRLYSDKRGKQSNKYNALRTVRGGMAEVKWLGNVGMLRPLDREVRVSIK